jgi:DNA-binding transcriptional LysR family regulator
LLPRLHSFSTRFPDIRVTVDTSQRVVDLTLDDFDVAIRFASTDKPQPNWTLLAEESLFPVCAPMLKERFKKLSDAELLSRAQLIHLTVVDNDWEYWFKAGGMEVPSTINSGLRVDRMQMAFDAAAQGLGVALGRCPLIDDEIEKGRLVRLAGHTITSGNAYWLVTSSPEFQSPEVKLFRQWLLSELQVSDDPVKPAQPKPAAKPVA